jgi:hypothetical protein
MIRASSPVESKAVFCVRVCAYNRLCGLVIKVSGYRYRGPGSIPGATRFFLRSSGSGTGSTQPRDDNLGAVSRK